MSVMHFANALVWEIIGPAMAGPTGPCATPMITVVNYTIFAAIIDPFMSMYSDKKSCHRLPQQLYKPASRGLSAIAGFVSDS